MLAVNAHAESILSISIEVYRNDSVRINYIRMENTTPTKYIPKGDYKIELLDHQEKTVASIPLSIAFTIMSDPPITMNSSIINLRIPYQQGLRYFVLYRNQSRILFQTIDPCNANGICDTKYESYLTCPQDCPLDRVDGICIKAADKKCDPDCGEGLDPDCGTSIQWFQTVLYILSALVVVVAVIFYLHNEIENRRIERQRREFLQWKKEHG